MPRRRAAAAASEKKKTVATQVKTAAASPEALKAALESQGSEGGMVVSPTDEAAMAVGKKKRSKKKTMAGSIPLASAPAPAPAPPDVSKLKVENRKSPISMAATTVAGMIKGRCRMRRRRRTGQTPPPATTSPPKGEVGSGGSLGGKGKKKKGAVPVPPPPEVSKLKVENSKSPISMAATTVTGKIKGTCRRRRRRRPGQTPPPATAAPPAKGAVGSSRWLWGRRKKAAVAGFGVGGKKRWEGMSRNRRKATVCGGSNTNTKRLSGKFKVIIQKRQARVPGIVGYLLVLQWPGGIEKLGKPLKKKFSSNEQWRLHLHGLWPLQKGRGDTYESISKNRIDHLRPKDLSSKVRKYLDVYFPSTIRGRSNIAFWGAEWLRHGKAAVNQWRSSDTTNCKASYLMESVSIFRKYRQKIENALRGLQAKMKDPMAHHIVQEIHREIGHLVKIQAVKCEGCGYLYQIHLFLDASLLLQDYRAGSLNDKRLYAMCNARDHINIP